MLKDLLWRCRSVHVESTAQRLLWRCSYRRFAARLPKDYFSAAVLVEFIALQIPSTYKDACPTKLWCYRSSDCTAIKGALVLRTDYSTSKAQLPKTYSGAAGGLVAIVFIKKKRQQSQHYAKFVFIE